MTYFDLAKTTPLPLHTQLLDDLRHKVLTGVLRANDQLPGEWEIATELDISRTTIQKAWHSAEQEGLIYRVPEKGTFVAEQPLINMENPAVGLVIPDFRDIFAAHLVHGVERVLHRKGYRLQVAASEYTIEKEDRVLRQMQSDNMCGCIIWAVNDDRDTRMLKAFSHDVPTVLVDRSVPGLHLPLVSSNNYVGGVQAMDHLIALGHRNIAFLARPHLHLWSVSERSRAYIDSMRRIGETPREPILIGSKTELSSYDAYLSDDDSAFAPLISLLKQSNRPTAIFAVNDWMAMRVLRATVAAGLRVPEDLSVVGFDNLEVAKSLTPSLTTVAQNTDQLGAEAAHRLIHLIDGEEVNEILSLLPTHLIVRGSTAAWMNNQ